MEKNGKYLLIVNPASGSVSKHKIVPHICKRLDNMGIDFEVASTRYPGHARELAAAAAAADRPAVLACGGDGTINEVASGLIGSNTALGIIPAGSGNGFARHLGIPVDIDSALNAIAQKNIIASDYGTANGRPFFCTFGVGFDAAVSERCARQKRRGILMYLKNTINEYVKFMPEEYVIEAGGRVITEKAFLVVCCNASQYGNNAFVAPEASVTDGELDITIVHGGDILSRAIVGVDMITGCIGKNALAETIRTSSAIIRRKRSGAAHIDGDAIAMGECIEVICHPGKLRVFSATESTRFIPFITPTRLFFRDIFLSISHIFGYRG